MTDEGWKTSDVRDAEGREEQDSWKKQSVAGATAEMARRLSEGGI